MTAHGLIESIFSRPQGGPGNERRITPDQLSYLRNLIDADEEGGAVKEGMNGGFAWMPKGRNKYVVTVDPLRNRRTLTRLSNLAPSDEGRLF